MSNNLSQDINWRLVLLIFIFMGMVVAGAIIMGDKQNKAMVEYAEITKEQMKKRDLESQVASSTSSGSMVLTIKYPPDKTIVNSKKIEITGTTNANAEVAINDKETTADYSGNFKVDLELAVGDNPIFIIANDTEGNWVEKEFNVTYRESL